MKTLIALTAVLLAACSSYDGRGLVPGQSTGAQVEALMGKPAERLSAPGGETVLFFPRAPQGRHTFAARIAPNGTLVALDQTLTKENMAKVVPEKSTAKDGSVTPLTKYHEHSIAVLSGASGVSRCVIT